MIDTPLSEPELRPREYVCPHCWLTHNTGAGDSACDMI